MAPVFSKIAEANEKCKERSHVGTALIQTNHQHFKCRITINGNTNA